MKAKEAVYHIRHAGARCTLVVDKEVYVHEQAY